MLRTSSALVAVCLCFVRASATDVYSIVKRIDDAALRSPGCVLIYKSNSGRQIVLIAYRGETDAFLFATRQAAILRDDRGMVFVRYSEHGGLREFAPSSNGEFPGDVQVDDFLVTPALRSMLKTQPFDNVVERQGGGWVVTRPYSKRSREGPLSAP